MADNALNHPIKAAATQLRKKLCESQNICGDKGQVKKNNFKSDIVLKYLKMGKSLRSKLHHNKENLTKKGKSKNLVL